MRKGSVLIVEQLTLVSMAVHGLFEYLCEQGGVEGSSPELEKKIEHARKAQDAVQVATAELTAMGAIREPS